MLDSVKKQPVRLPQVVLDICNPERSDPEVLPLEMNRDLTLAQLDIEFLAEAFYGDQVCSEMEMGHDVCIHQLRNAAGATLCLANSRFLGV